MFWFGMIFLYFWVFFAVWGKKKILFPFSKQVEAFYQVGGATKTVQLKLSRNLLAASEILARKTKCKIGVPTAVPAHFTITSERAYDRLFKRLRWAKEPQIGEAEFDQRYYLSGGAWLSELFTHNEQAKEAVYGLFSQAERYGKLRVHCRAGVLWLELKSRKSVSFTKSDILVFGGDLVQLSHALALEAKPSWRLATIAEKHVNPVMSAGSWAALACGVVMFILFNIAVYKQFDLGKLMAVAMPPAAIVAAGLFAVMLYFNFRTPRFQRVLASFVLLWLPGIALASVMTHSILNWRLDASNPEMQCVSVVDKSISKRSSGKRGRTTHYYVFFEWAVRNEPKEKRSWEVGSSFYNQVQIGELVSFTKHRGYWDAPLIHSIELGCR